jgi:coenzyme PQQ precursor peptide PqqA
MPDRRAGKNRLDERSLLAHVSCHPENPGASSRRNIMKTWMKPQVREQEVGLEVTSYLPAEIDVI